jgi:hypothetical protein
MKDLRGDFLRVIFRYIETAIPAGPPGIAEDERVRTQPGRDQHVASRFGIQVHPELVVREFTCFFQFTPYLFHAELRFYQTSDVIESKGSASLRT